MTVSCCSWWWSDKTIKNVSDQRWWSSKQPSRATVSLEKSVFFFFLLTVVQSDRVSWLALPEETRRVSTLSSRDINTFNKVNMSLWPRVSSTFTVQRNMAKLHRCVQKYTEQSTKWQCFSSRCWNDARSTSPAVCVFVFMYICVYVCVCVSVHVILK